ncbi:MAG: tetratricopeptide repeat protein [Gemmatimonadaceae bacterium]
MSIPSEGEASPSTLLTATLWTRLAALETRLSEGAGAAPDAAQADVVQADAAQADAAALKADIFALFKEVEQASGTLAEVTQRIKGLASQWTARFGAPRETATPARVDHLAASTFVEKGWSRLATDDLPGAIAALEQALAHAPNDVEAAALLGWARAWHGDTAGAERLLVAVLRQAPEDPLALTAMGFVRVAGARCSEAGEYFRQALSGERSPKATLYAHLGRGMALAGAGATDDADAAFATALAIGPNLVQAWYARGEALWRAGRLEAARAAWQAGAQGSRFTPWSARCAMRLTSVTSDASPSA